MAPVLLLYWQMVNLSFMNDLFSYANGTGIVTFPVIQYHFRSSCLFAMTVTTPFAKMVLTRKNNYIHYKVWDEITAPWPKSNGGTFEVVEWICNFIPHFIDHGFMGLVTLRGLKVIHVSKRAPTFVRLTGCSVMCVESFLHCAVQDW